MQTWFFELPSRYGSFHTPHGWGWLSIIFSRRVTPSDGWNPSTNDVWKTIFFLKRWTDTPTIPTGRNSWPALWQLTQPGGYEECDLLLDTAGWVGFHCAGKTSAWKQQATFLGVICSKFAKWYLQNQYITHLVRWVLELKKRKNGPRLNVTGQVRFMQVDVWFRGGNCEAWQVESCVFRFKLIYIQEQCELEYQCGLYVRGRYDWWQGAVRRGLSTEQGAVQRALVRYKQHRGAVRGGQVNVQCLYVVPCTDVGGSISYIIIICLFEVWNLKLWQKLQKT